MSTPPKAPLTLARFAKHVNSLGNKDKVIKIFQYGAQALLHYVYTDKSDPATRKLNALFWGLVLHRKLFRYLNFLTEIINIRTRVRELQHDKEKIVPLCLIGKHISFLIFWILDNAVYLSMGKLADFDAGPPAMLSYKLWTVANIFNMLKNLRLYQKCNPKDQEKLNDVKLALVKDASDMIVSVGFSKMADPYISWGHIGFAGIVSAVLHLKLGWPRDE